MVLVVVEMMNPTGDEFLTCEESFDGVPTFIDLKRCGENMFRKHSALQVRPVRFDLFLDDEKLTNKNTKRKFSELVEDGVSSVSLELVPKIDKLASEGSTADLESCDPGFGDRAHSQEFQADGCNVGDASSSGVQQHAIGVDIRASQTTASEIEGLEQEVMILKTQLARLTPAGVQFQPAFVPAPRMGMVSPQAFCASFKRSSRLTGKGVHLFLVVGETGSGKSTFLNMMANYYRNGSYPDNVKVIIPSKAFPTVTEQDIAQSSSEAHASDQSRSQTTKATRYTFPGDHVFVFIDTPGFGDTGGVQQDEANLDAVLKAAEDAGELHGIILVANGRAPRFTEHLRYVLTKLRSNVPDVVMNNFVAVMTNCTELTVTFPMQELEVFKPKSIRHMDNTFFHRNPQSLSEGAAREARNEWARSLATIQEMERDLCEMHGTSTDDFKVLRESRFQIKQELHSVRGEVEKLQIAYDALEAERAKEVSFGKSAQSFSHFTHKKTIRVPVTKSQSGTKNTTCSNCSHCCHAGCSLQETTSTGTNVFSGCAAMGSNGHCRECPGKCHHSSHYHSSQTTTYEDKTIEEVLADVKAKYDSAKADQNRAASQVQTYQSTINMLNTAMQSVQQKVIQKMGEIRRVASHFNLTNELQSEITILKRNSQGLTTPAARQKHDAMISALEIQLKNLQRA